MAAITAKTAYKEDVIVVAPGSEIVDGPCLVYSITAAAEADGDAIVNFSNVASAYSSTYRVAKICLTAENHTVTLTFPNGLPCSNGLYAISNVAGVDITVTYE